MPGGIASAYVAVDENTPFTRAGPALFGGPKARRTTGISPLHSRAILRVPFAPRLFAPGLHVRHYARVVRECRIFHVDVDSVPGNAVFQSTRTRRRAASSVG